MSSQTFNGKPIAFQLPGESVDEWLVRRMQFRISQVEKLLQASDTSRVEASDRGRQPEAEPSHYDNVSRKVWGRSPHRMPSRSPTPPAIRMERQREKQKMEEERERRIEHELEMRRKEEKRRKHLERMARINAKQRGEDPDLAVAKALAQFEEERIKIRQRNSHVEPNTDNALPNSSVAPPKKEEKQVADSTNNGLLKREREDFGDALLAGEGSAIAAYLKSGKRIPRRGEIGLSSDEITKYEQAGFVMSGSRHKRMNAVRIRKENQVITTEEKKAMLLQRKEELEKQETEVIAELQDIVRSKIKTAEKKVIQDDNP